MQEAVFANKSAETDYLKKKKSSYNATYITLILEWKMINLSRTKKEQSFSIMYEMK